MAPLHALEMDDIINHQKFTWIITAFTLIYAQLTHLESVFCGFEPIGFIASGSERFILLLFTGNTMSYSPHPCSEVFRSLCMNWTRPARGRKAVTELLAESPGLASWQLVSIQMWGATPEQQRHGDVSWNGPQEEDSARFRGTGRVGFPPLSPWALLWGLRQSAGLAFLQCRSIGRELL